jgi:hypothetical protein
LWWNLRRLYFYIDNNAGTLVNYGACYRKGLPISSSIAESAVNQVDYDPTGHHQIASALSRSRSRDAGAVLSTDKVFGGDLELASGRLAPNRNPLQLQVVLPVAGRTNDR